MQRLSIGKLCGMKDSDLLHQDNLILEAWDEVRYSSCYRGFQTVKSLTLSDLLWARALVSLQHLPRPDSQTWIEIMQHYGENTPAQDVAQAIQFRRAVACD